MNKTIYQIEEIENISLPNDNNKYLVSVYIKIISPDKPNDIYLYIPEVVEVKTKFKDKSESSLSLDSSSLNIDSNSNLEGEQIVTKSGDYYVRKEMNLEPDNSGGLIFQLKCNEKMYNPLSLDILISNGQYSFFNKLDSKVNLGFEINGEIIDIHKIDYLKYVFLIDSSDLIDVQFGYEITLKNEYDMEYKVVDYRKFD